MTKRSTPGRHGWTVLLALVALVCLVAGATLLVRGLSTAPNSGAPMPEQTFDLGAEAVPDPVDGPERPQAPDLVAADDTLFIPAIDTQGHLISLGLAGDGSLELPTAVDELTLWSGSAPLDAHDGAVLIAGHVDDANQGAGSLFRMHALQPGDAVYVNDNGVNTRWKVVGLEVIVKAALPERVFDGPGGERRLYLVTCGGPIATDAQGRATYRDNVIATAVPF